MPDTVESHGGCTKEVQISPGTVRVILVNCLQEEIKIGANANMENLYNQGNSKPTIREEMSLPCSVQTNGDLGEGTITVCKHSIGSYTREGEKLL